MLEWLVFRPETILVLAQLMLSLVITGVLWKHREYSKASRLLGLFFVSNSLGTLFHYLTYAGMVVVMEYWTDAFTLFFYLVGALLLNEFALAYPHQLLQQKKSWLRKISMSAAVGLGVFSCGLYGFTGEHPYLMLLLALNVVGYLSAVFTLFFQAKRVLASEHGEKRSVKQVIGRAALGKRMSDAAQVLYRSQNRTIKAIRAFMLIVALYFLLSILSAVYWIVLHQWVSLQAYYLFNVAGMMLFLLFFIQAYLAYAQEPTTFMMKLNLSTLTLVLFVTATVGFIYLEWVQREQYQDWLEEVEVVAGEVRAGEYETRETYPDRTIVERAITFLVSYPEEAVSLWAKQATFSYEPPAGIETARVHFIPEQGFQLDDFKRDRFVAEAFQPGRGYTGNKPTNTYITYAFTHGDWYYVMGFPASELQNSINPKAMQVKGLLALSVLIVMFIFPRFFKWSLVAPLRLLLNGVQEVGEGNLKVEVPMDCWQIALIRWPVLWIGLISS